jgi:hypothetical protein
MAKGISVGSLLSANQLEEMLEIPKGSFSPVAWLVLQEMAAGTPTGTIAKSLGIEPDDLISLRDSTTGKEGEESQDLWLQGILTLKTAARLNQNTVHTGWDAIEAIALQKAHGALMATQSNGDLDQMMRIAATANKAARRSQGEGMKQGGTNINVNPNTGDIELQSGDLGFIRLRVSPAVSAQLQNPDRVIDGKVNRPSVLKNMEMVSLDDIRSEGDRASIEEETRRAEETEARNQRLRDQFGDSSP